MLIRKIFRQMPVPALVCALVAAPVAAQEEVRELPRLVLQLTVDQLRGDLIDRYGQHLGEGGFRRLLDAGLHFVDAHHRHANTETIVGHTTLATGHRPGHPRDGRQPLV